MQGGDDGLGVSAQRELGAVLIPPFLNAGIQRALVNDANSSSDGEKFNAVFFFQGSSQGGDFPDGFQEGFRLGKLGADMHLQPFQMKVRKFAGRHLIKRFNAFEVHAEFIFSLAGSNVFVRSRLYVGIDAHGHRSLDSHGGGNGVNGPQFRFGFHIEAINALGQGITDFLLGFSYAGISAFGRISPGFEDAEEFSAGDDVESRPVAGHEVQDGDVGAGLDGVGHFRVKRCQSFPEAVKMV